jgi:hypothetical protein
VIFTVLAQEGGIAWMHARHPHSGGSFIIATAVSDEEEERATRLLKNEFALRDMLQDSWAIRAVASTQYRGRFALVYAPFSFELLARRAGRAISGIARFIEMAIQICVPLRQMHLQNLIHGDIKPGSIFVHHDATCRLGSFGLSSSRSPMPSPRPGLPFQAVRPRICRRSTPPAPSAPSTAAAISTASAWCCMNS